MPGAEQKPQKKIVVDLGDEYSIPRDELHEALLEANRINKIRKKEGIKQLVKTARSAGTC